MRAAYGLTIKAPPRRGQTEYGIRGVIALCRKASRVPARLSPDAIHNAGKTMRDYAVSQPNRIRVLFAAASQSLSLFILSPVLPAPSLHREALLCPFPKYLSCQRSKEKSGTGNSLLLRTCSFYISRWTAIRLYQRGDRALPLKGFDVRLIDDIAVSPIKESRA